MVFLEMRSGLLDERRYEGHALRNVLRLVHHGAVEALVLHRLAQDLLHVHRPAHVPFKYLARLESQWNLFPSFTGKVPYLVS